MVELYAGTMGHSRGWLERGGYAVGFDIDHQQHHGPVPEGGDLVLQDVLTLHGSQFKDADLICASAPCQKYSWLAMPWSRSVCPVCRGTKIIREWGPPRACDCKENSKQAKELRADWMKNGPNNRLFDACYRIQREAIEATGYACEMCIGNGQVATPSGWWDCHSCNGTGRKGTRYIPLIIENVRGSIPWVGKRDMSLDHWNALSQTERIQLGRPGAEFGSFMLWGDVAQIGNRVIAGTELVAIRAGQGRFGMGIAPEKASVKVTGQIQGKEYALARTGASGQKQLHSRGDNQTCGKHRMGLGAENLPAGSKQGGDWFGDMNGISKHGSGSNARRAASALIARIPPDLSDYLARVHFPTSVV